MNMDTAGRGATGSTTAADEKRAYHKDFEASSRAELNRALYRLLTECPSRPYWVSRWLALHRKWVEAG